MHEMMNPGEKYANWKAPRTSESGRGVANGEINKNKEVGSTPVETAASNFSAIIKEALEKKGGAGLSPAEADGVRKEILNMNVGGEIIKEIKAADYHDTGKSITIPMDAGDATFKLSIYRNTEQSKFKFQLEAVNDLAKRLESN